MARSEFADHVYDQLLELGEISYGGFFGGTGYKIGDVQFAMCMGDTLYFVVDDDTRPRYRDAGSEPFSYPTKKGTRLVHRYYEVPGEVLEDREVLLDWARGAVAAAMKPTRRKRRKR